MLYFKGLHMNPLNIVTLLTIKVVLGDYPTRLKTILTIFKYKIFKVNDHRYSNIVAPTVCALKKNSLSLFISVLVMYLLLY